MNFLAHPSDPLANAAWIIMEREDTTPMLGSNSIYVTVVLLETGRRKGAVTMNIEVMAKRAKDGRTRRSKKRKRAKEHFGPNNLS